MCSASCRTAAAVTNVHDEIRTITLQQSATTRWRNTAARGAACPCAAVPPTAEHRRTTGNQLDMKVFIPRSIWARAAQRAGGTPYQIIGYMNSVNDFSTVVFRRSGRTNCTFCHEGGIVPPPNSRHPDRRSDAAAGGFSVRKRRQSRCNPDLAPWPAARSITGASTCPRGLRAPATTTSTSRPGANHSASISPR